MALARQLGDRMLGEAPRPLSGIVTVMEMSRSPRSGQRAEPTSSS